MFLKAAGAPLRETHNSPKNLHLKFNPSADVEVFFSGIHRLERKGFKLWTTKITSHERNNSIAVTMPAFSFNYTLWHPAQGSATWRSMLVTQPPVTALCVKANHRITGSSMPSTGGWERWNMVDDDMYATVWNPTGLTYGDLVDMIVTLREQGQRLDGPTWHVKEFLGNFDSSMFEGEEALRKSIKGCDRKADRKRDGICQCLSMFVPTSGGKV